MNESKTSLPSEIDFALGALRSAARKLRVSPLADRNKVLTALTTLLHVQKSEILTANLRDLAALPGDVPLAFRDRLTIDSARIQGMCESLRQVAELEDPLGEIVEARTLENGLRTRRIRSPLGVVFMIFESRPNVAIEAFSLALKSGNALILRGGKESRETTAVLYRLIGDALVTAGLPREVFLGIVNPDRGIVQALLQEKARIDVVVPRGGEGLIHFVEENSRIPIIKNDRGLCHIYVHEDAQLDQGVLIVENAKVQRPGVCNAVETILLHAKIAEPFIGKMSKNQGLRTVYYRACPRSKEFLQNAFPGQVKDATELDFDTEYLDLILNVKIVDNAEEAMRHIEKHGSKHSESILTSNEKLARNFQTEIDAAAVYWNASTRFTDGFSLGLGGELGISTQKLHVRGPVGLRELTSIRWIIDGEGQIR